MEKIRITVKDEWGTPKNHHGQFLNDSYPFKDANKEWKEFNDAHPSLPAPNIKDGEWWAEAKWQYNDIYGEWCDCFDGYDHELAQYAGDKTRQIYTLSPEAPVSLFESPLQTLDTILIYGLGDDNYGRGKKLFGEKSGGNPDYTQILLSYGKRLCELAGRPVFGLSMSEKKELSEISDHIEQISLITKQ